MRGRRLVVAALGAVVALGVPAPAAVPSADPGRPGALPVQAIDYDAGVTVVSSDLGQRYTERLRGVLHVPGGPARPHPVLVLVHGRHDTCRVAGRDLGLAATVLYPCPDAPPAVQDLPSWHGFDYVARVLASQGYVVVAPSVNAVNALGTLDGAAERSQVVAATLQLVKEWGAGARLLPDGVGASLQGRVDLGRIGLMGHSRGADGVGRFLRDEQARGSGRMFPGLRAVLEVQGVDSTLGNPAPYGVALGTVLGTCDGDTGAGGTAMWERGRWKGTAPRVQWVVTGANHDFFNTEWYDEWDSPPPPTVRSDNPTCAPTVPGNRRLSRADQQAVGVRLMTAFFRTFVGGERGYDGLVTGREGLPAAACPKQGRPVACDQVLATSYLPGDERVLLALDRVGALSTAGPVTVTPCRPEAATPKACPEADNASVAPQRTVEWEGPSVLRLPTGTASRSVLRLRLAMNPRTCTVPVLDVRVRARDASGHQVVVPLKGAAVRRPLPGGAGAFETGDTGGYLNLVLHQARVVLTGVDTARLTSLELLLGGSGSMQLDEVVATRS